MLAHSHRFTVEVNQIYSLYLCNSTMFSSNKCNIAFVFSVGWFAAAVTKQFPVKDQ